MGVRNFFSFIFFVNFLFYTYSTRATANTVVVSPCADVEVRKQFALEAPMFTKRELELGDKREDRRLAKNINRITGEGQGDVHVNMLSPGAQAGDHYHKELIEYFINLGPGVLILHLRDPQTGEYQRIVMPPVNMDGGSAFHVRPGVAHLVENLNSEMVTLIIVVNEDNPDDRVPYKVFEE